MSTVDALGLFKAVWLLLQRTVCAVAVSGVVVVGHYTGLTVAEMSELRLRMSKAGGAVRVAKNKLAKIALQDKSCEAMGALFTGQTVLMYSDDQVAAAKIAVEFSKENEKLVILGGTMGAKSLDSAAVLEVSKMPSRVQKCQF